MFNKDEKNKIFKLKQTLEEIMAPTKELAHGIETLQWLLKIKPNAEWQTQIAAFSHDVERTVPYIEGKYPPKPEKNDYSTYDLYKQAHALRSAEIVGNIMKDQHFLDTDIARVCSAIRNHEVGGDSDSDLVRDADSIRWFDKGYEGYIEKSGINGAKEKGWWMFKRATKETKELILSLNFDTNIKQFIKNNVANLPYRQGVYGLMLNDKDQILLVFKRNSKMWDFPGGGVDKGESLEQAIKREILEELSTSSISIVGISSITNKYDWPEKEMEKNFSKTGIWKRGQEQHFIVLKFLGSDKEIKLQEEELLESKWVNKDDLQKYMSYPDQYETVAKALAEFK